MNILEINLFSHRTKQGTFKLVGYNLSYMVNIVLLSMHTGEAVLFDVLITRLSILMGIEAIFIRILFYSARVKHFALSNV